MRDLGFVAHALDVIHHVVGVFLQRVVDARFEIRLRSVVVDPQPAADVHVGEARAGALQFHVHARRFHHRGLDLPDVGDLAAQVEMQKLEAILHPGRFQLFQRAQRFGHGQPELRAVPARRFPAPRAAAGQLDPQPDGRPHAYALGMLQDQVELGVFFDHRNDPPADLRGQHHHLDVLVVLEAVADDRRVVVGDGQHRQQLRLRAGLQAELERAPVFENFLHHLPLLVHLDRIHAAVIALVVVLGDGVLKRLVHFAQPVLAEFRRSGSESAERCRATADCPPAPSDRARAAGPCRDARTGARSRPPKNSPCPNWRRRIARPLRPSSSDRPVREPEQPLVNLTVAMKFQCPSI